jgi:hypothetical protein
MRTTTILTVRSAASSFQHSIHLMHLFPTRSLAAIAKPLPGPLHLDRTADAESPVYFRFPRCHPIVLYKTFPVFRRSPEKAERFRNLIFQIVCSCFGVGATFFIREKRLTIPSRAQDVRFHIVSYVIDPGAQVSGATRGLFSRWRRH